MVNYKTASNVWRWKMFTTSSQFMITREKLEDRKDAEDSCFLQGYF